VRLHRRRPPGPCQGGGLHPDRERYRDRPVPLVRLRVQPGLAHHGDDRADPAGLAQAPSTGRRPGQAEPRTLAVPGPSRRRPHGPRRPPQTPEDSRRLALGRGDQSGMAAYPRPADPAWAALSRPRNPRKPPGPVEPRHPARQPGPCHTRTLKSRPSTAILRPSATASNPREQSGLARQNPISERIVVHASNRVSRSTGRGASRL
jgi:hypothetical protein